MIRKTFVNCEIDRDVTPTSQAREMVRVFGCLTDWFSVSHAYMLTVLNMSHSKIANELNLNRLAVRYISNKIKNNQPLKYE